MTTGKTIALNIQTFVGKVMSLLFHMQSRFVIAFSPRSKCLLISWHFKFTPGNVCISMLFFQFVPPSPSPTVSISLFSMSESLLLPLLEPLNGKCTLRISERQRGTCGVFHTYFITEIFLCRASFRTGISGTHLSHSGLAYLEMLQLQQEIILGTSSIFQAWASCPFKGLFPWPQPCLDTSFSWLLALFTLVCLSLCLASCDFHGSVLESSNSTQLPPSQILSGYQSPEGCCLGLPGRGPCDGWPIALRCGFLVPNPMPLPAAQSSINRPIPQAPMRSLAPLASDSCTLNLSSWPLSLPIHGSSLSL